MSKILIYRASEVVTCSGTSAKSGVAMTEIGLLPHASIACVDGVIQEIIKEETPIDLEKYRSEGYQIIDAKGKTVTPGYVDSHTHLVFGGYREEEYNWRLEGVSYMDIMNRGGGIVNSVSSTRAASKEELIDIGLRRLHSMMSFGVTTVEAKSGYGLNLETEIKQLEVIEILQSKHPIDLIPTFMGPHATPKEFEGRTDDFVDYLIDEVLPVVAERNLAVFADIFCEQGVFSLEQTSKFLLAARKYGLQLKMHADEIVSFGGAELAAELGAVSADHLLQVSDQGIEDMAAAGVVGTVLPMTAFSLSEPFAPVRKMIDRGMKVALATDFNPGSCFSESIPLLIALATNKMHMTIAEVLTALTINAAEAVGMADVIGSIDIGKKADLLIHEFESHRFIPYHICVNTVEKVIKNGKIVVDRALESPY